MEKLFVQKTDYSPEIILDHENKIFEIKGESRPDNVREFYGKVFDWFTEYCNLLYFNNCKSYIELKLSFDYFNSTSTKTLYDIIAFLNNKSKNYNFDFKVVWFYRENDKDMLESGQELSTILGLDFVFLKNEMV